MNVGASTRMSGRVRRNAARVSKAEALRPHCCHVGAYSHMGRMCGGPWGQVDGDETPVDSGSHVVYTDALLVPRPTRAIMYMYVHPTRGPTRPRLEGSRACRYPTRD